jgi:hypothetical protein
LPDGATLDASGSACQRHVPGGGCKNQRDPRREGETVGEALLLCLVGSLYPVALLAVLTYLGSARPLPTAAAFLAGGVVISFITGTALVVLFRQFNVDPDHRPTLSGGVNIGLGIAVMVASAIWLVINYRRRRNSDTPDELPPDEPTEKTLRAALIAGILVYLPMLSYFAAIKIIANQNYSARETVGTLVACVVVSLTVTELPIVVVALVGERANPMLRSFARFVSRNTATILLLTGLGVGIYLVVKGIGEL